MGIHSALVVYQVHEIFYSLQGEGAHSGRPALFCRFSGCNLWSGREQDRERAVCRFCDTSFRGIGGDGGGAFSTAAALADQLFERWQRETCARGAAVSAGSAAGGVPPYVICTGGEPLLQLDECLVAALHARGCQVAVETNGTLRPPAGIDWLCVSPKAGAPLVVTGGDELKLVFPQSGVMPEELESLAFRHFFLQPCDGPEREANTTAALAYCKAHPRWRLSLQIHKILAIR